MKFTLSWLKDHLETDATLDQIVEKLTMIGLEVEEVDTREAFKPFTIAKVLSAEKHPDADKLKVLSVDIGSGTPIQVVCGAPNARAGLIGAFAGPGTYVPGIDVTLSVGNIRGVESHGMMCSERELELSDAHDGIIDLPEDAPVGTPFADYANLIDPVIEIGITPNRPDALGVAGIAADLADKKLRIGASDAVVKTLRRRLMISGDLSTRAGQSKQFDTYVDTAVKRFQRRHGLPPDGVLGRYSFAALNIPADIRLGQLQTNLVRLRAMSGFLGNRYVMVNIPAAQIEAVENDRVAQRHTAIVGRISRQTPILNSKIYELNLNPFWNAPVSIVRRDIIPLMQKNPKYLTENKIRIFDRNKNELDPASIDWNTDEAVNYHFRQDPSRINAMGTVKINFPNPHAVYMHDTPQKSLFGKLLRFDSSGCVRVQNVRDLLVWLAKDTPNWSRPEIEQVITAGDRTDLKLATPVPVYFTYITAWSTQGSVVQFRDDIYQRDGVDELALNQ